MRAVSFLLGGGALVNSDNNLLHAQATTGTVTVTDPSGDSCVNPGATTYPDSTSITATKSGNSVTFTISHTGSFFVGDLHLDIDQNPATGTPIGEGQVCVIPPGGELPPLTTATAEQTVTTLGEDFAIRFASDGTAFLYYWELVGTPPGDVFWVMRNVGDVPATVTDTVVQLTLDLSLVGGDDGNVDFIADILGFGGDDRIPNAGHATLAIAADTMPPETTITNLTPQVTNINPMLLVTGSDGENNVSAIEYFVGDDPGTGFGIPLSPIDGAYDSHQEEGTVSVDVTDIPDGIYTIFVRARDSAGNWDVTPATVLMTVDTIGPAIVVFSPREKIYLITDEIPIDFSISDNMSGVGRSAVTIDGTTFASGGRFESKALGIYTLDVTAVDLAGNVSTSAVTFSVDITLEGIGARINELAQSGKIINSGISTSFEKKVWAARRALESGDIDRALNAMTALLNEIKSHEGKGIALEEGRELAGYVTYLMATIADNRGAKTDLLQKFLTSTEPIIKIVDGVPEMVSGPDVDKCHEFRKLLADIRNVDTGPEHFDFRVMIPSDKGSDAYDGIMKIGNNGGEGEEGGSVEIVNPDYS